MGNMLKALLNRKAASMVAACAVLLSGLTGLSNPVTVPEA